MEVGKASGEDQITADLLKDGRQVILEKLTSLYTKCPMIVSIPEFWKNAIIIIIHKKGDTKYLKKIHAYPQSE